MGEVGLKRLPDFAVKTHTPVKANLFVNTLRQATDERMLHGQYFWGHGVQNQNNVYVGFDLDGRSGSELLSKLTIQDSKDYLAQYSTPIYPKEGMRYKLGMGLFFVCGGETGYTILSSCAVKYGVSDTLIPWGKFNPGNWMTNQIDYILAKQFDQQ